MLCCELYFFCSMRENFGLLRFVLINTNILFHFIIFKQFLFLSIFKIVLVMIITHKKANFKNDFMRFPGRIFQSLRQRQPASPVGRVPRERRHVYVRIIPVIGKILISNLKKFKYGN
jgi:hypothetical protein